MATTDYKNVIKLSINPYLLIAAHNIVISEKEATKIIFAYLDESEVSVRFSCKKNGAALGGKNGFIRLPDGGSKYLTRGLVLHEVAHIINHNDNKKRGHSIPFVIILDNLLKSELEWGNISCL